MSAVPKNVVELRKTLAEKFPGVKMSAGPRASIQRRWPTGIEAFDAVLGGGLVRGGIAELVTPGIACGSASILAGLIVRARHNGEWLALVDAMDTFDPAALGNATLERLLWLRCAGARDAIKAADLLLHDGTAAVTVLDLAFCPPEQLRRTPSSTWFRLGRLVENSATALLVITPQPTISTAEIRLRLERRFALDALDRTHEILARQLAPEPIEAAVRIVKTA